MLTAGRGHVRQVTLAPERDHGLDLVRHLRASGVHAAIGHTAATFAQVSAAVGAGADLATHLFNAMDPWHHREPGAVAALLRAAVTDGLTVELIADGVHLSDDTVRTVVDLVGASRVAFVSDAMAAAGVGDGPYVLGGLLVVVVAGAPHGCPPARSPEGPATWGTSSPARWVPGHRWGMPLSRLPAHLPGSSGWPIEGRCAWGARRPRHSRRGGSGTRVMRAGRWL